MNGLAVSSDGSHGKMLVETNSKEPTGSGCLWFFLLMMTIWSTCLIVGFLYE